MPEELNVNVDGREIKVHVLRGDSNPSEVLLGLVATGRIQARDDEIGKLLSETMVGKASAQLENLDQFGLLTNAGTCEAPPVRPEYYSQLYRTTPMNRACIDTKVADMVGLGYRIRPRAELFPRAMDLERKGKPNAKEQARVESFVDLAMASGMESFTDINCQMVMDRETSGQGYIEFSRDNNGAVNGIFSTKGETFRIASGGPQNGFWQSRGGKWRYFAPYTGEKGVKVADVVGGRVEFRSKSEVVPVSFGYRLADGAELSFKAGDFSRESARDTTRANEILMFKKMTPKDTHYGEPDIISGIEDTSISQGVRLFILSYFDNGAVPRLILYVSGDTILSDDTVHRIESYLSGRERYDASNQTMILQIPEGCAFNKEILTDAHLTDSTSMLDLRDRCDLYVALVHRVPLSAIPAVVGSQSLNRATSDESNRRYVGSVVRPGQRYIEERWDYVFRSELGISEWVIDFEIPDLLDLKTKHEIWQIGCLNGFYTINEVRAALNLPPVEGGEIPILRIPGQGAVLISEIEQVSKGAKPKDIMATGHTKTPPNGVQELQGAKELVDGNGKAVSAWVMPTAEMPKMDPAETEMVLKAVEELTINPDDVKKLAKEV